MKKRWISMLLAALMVCTAFPLTVFAAGDADTVELTISEQSGKTQAKVGDTLTYSIEMDTDATVYALEFALIVPSNLQVTSITAEKVAVDARQSLNEETLHLAAYGMNYKSDSATKLMTVTCKVVSSGTGSLGVDKGCFVTYINGTQDILDIELNSQSLSVAGTSSSAPTEEESDESDSSSDGKVSSSEVKEEFENSKKDTVTFDVSEDSKVSKTLFTLLTENEDKEAVLKGDGYTWTIKGSDVSGKMSTSYFDSQVRSSTPKKNAIKKLTDSAEVQNIRLAQEGSLPCEATLTLSVDKALRGKALYCYYYNEATNSLELVAADLKVKNGKVSIIVDRGQDYILTNALLSYNSGEKLNPETGAGL